MIPKRLAAMLLSLMLMFLYLSPAMAYEPTPQSSEFSDVTPGHWAYDAITSLVARNILSGYPDSTFRPNNQITRAEFAKIMVLALNLGLKNPEQPSFKDIKIGNWEYAYVETSKSYLTGFRTSQGDFFKPSNPAVREDMAVALVKALKYDTDEANESVLGVFADKGSISPNLMKYVAAAVSHGIMEGYPTGSGEGKAFKPQNSLTRAEVAALLYRVSESEKVTYDDETPVPTPRPAQGEAATSKYALPQVAGRIDGNKIVLNWQPITDARLQGYKVVISKYNSNPKYPDDGYLYWITDRNRTYAVVDNSQAYNGGDLEGYLVPGEKYYFSITAVYGDKKVPGNVIELTFPR